MSIASGVGRGSRYGRSNSRYSTNAAVSRPHTPVQASNQVWHFTTKFGFMFGIGRVVILSFC